MLTRPEIIARRRELRIESYKSLSDVGFEGDWVTPYQIASCSSVGPVLVALHWLDDASIDRHRDVLSQRGYLPAIRFNKVLDLALAERDLERSGIYMTQAFHLIPRDRSQQVKARHVDESFDAVTRHELVGRRVVALGDVAARACQRHGIKHTSTCHPSRRGYSNVQNAEAIAQALRSAGA